MRFGPLLLLSCLFASGCQEETPIRVANEPPSVQILDPVVGDSGEAGPYNESEAIVLRVAAADTEDLPGEIVLDFSTVAVDAGGTPTVLGQGQPDSEGFAEFVVTGLGAGHHLLEVTAWDSDMASAQARLPVLVLGAANAPQVFITAPNDGSEATAGEPLTFAATAADDAGAQALAVEWWSNRDGVLDTSSASIAGLLTFTTDVLSEGPHAITLTVVDATGLSATAAVSVEIVPANLPPTGPTVLVEPAAPLTDDDLSCLVTVAPTDPEGQPVELLYRWQRDGVDHGWDEPLLPASETSRGEAWTCVVAGFDGVLASVEGSDTVVVGNTPPSADAPSLGPSPAFESTVLSCTPGAFEDADDDAEFWSFDWEISGVPIGATTATLTGADFDRGDLVTCVVTPNDGLDAGAPQSSNPVLVENTEPTAPTIAVTPAPSAGGGSPIGCAISGASVDDDADLIDYEVHWLRDGVQQVAWDNVWTVDPSATSLGEQWTCEVRASDGTGFSAWVSASTSVLPVPGDLVVTEFMSNPDAVSDAAGEWIELYNSSGASLDLDGFELADDGADSHIVVGPLIVGAGGRVVLARNDEFLTNGGVTASYLYSGFVLDNTADEILLRFDGVEIDRVEYQSAAYTYSLLGHTGSLDPSLGAPSASNNDAAGSWCASMQPIAGPTGDFGTPGGPNDHCACAPTDQDLDGFGDGAWCATWDCDDTRADVYPGGIELCGNGIDEDCSGADTPCSCASTDGDGDGYGDGPACATLDCDDNNASIHPGATELCNNVNDDCDASIDEGWDIDADGWTTCEDDCDDASAGIHPGATELCNSIDDDCDGPVDEGWDGDGDGWTSCAGDCNNSNASVHPGQQDTCDGTDSDCDGSVDENAAGDVFEPNNSSGSAYILGGDDTIIDLWATIHGSGDASDWYAITTTDDFDFLCDLFYVSATLDSIPSGTDYDLYLYDDSLNLLDASAATSNSSEAVFWEPGCTSPGDDGGLYYLRIARWSGSSCMDTYHAQIENAY